MKDYFTSTQKKRLVRSLFTKTSPAYIQYYITARCNLECEQCNIIYADADSYEMNIDQIRSMAKNLAEIGVCIVLLIGGEPFVRKDIVEIVSSFTENGIHVRLQTNGLARKETLKRCVDAGAHDISISLDTLSPDIQESINGNFQDSWNRTIKSIANINEMFPHNGTAFLGTVFMPRNINHIKDVIEFATAIGWGVSLVPAHVSTPDLPRGFRTFDDKNICRFPNYTYPRVREVLENVKCLRKKGFNIYDSDEYLDDIYRFIVGQPIRWRRRNDNLCDSPNLYFAIEPNGNINPCCDFKLKNSYPVYHKKFPEWYRKGLIHREIYSYTRNCSGCMYGSYPEITITARFLLPMIKRFLYFNKTAPNLKRFSYFQMLDITERIFEKNRVEREEAELEIQRLE